MKTVSESNNSLNIVFLSSNSSGKSSLLYRLFNNSFKEKINEKKRFYRFIINYYDKPLTINFFILLLSIKSSLFPIIPN